MPPKATQASRWGSEEREAILYGFRELNWDPFEVSGPAIKKLLKSLPKEQFDKIKKHFSTSETGGTKSNNNTLYGHFKNIGCEFIVEKTRAGWRRKTGEGASVCCSVPGTGSHHHLSLILLSFIHSFIHFS